MSGLVPAGLALTNKLTDQRKATQERAEKEG